MKQSTITILITMHMFMVGARSFGQDSQSQTKRTINVETAGSLPTLISDEEKYTIEELTLTGELNGTDFRLLRDMAGNDYKGELTNGKLITLDLSGVRVVAGGDMYLDTDHIQTSPNSGNYGAFHIYTDTDHVPTQAFMGCSLLNIVLPRNITQLDDFAFYCCNKLESIIIPEGVESLGCYAFGNCENLKSLVIPESVTNINDRCFSYCTSLKTISIPQNVRSISIGAFEYCSSLNEFVVNSNNQQFSTIDGVLYNKSKTNLVVFPAAKSEKYTVPEGVKTIDCYAFSCSSTITSVVLPSSVTLIEKGAFADCVNLTSVNIPNGVQSIQVISFWHCSGLTSVTSMISEPYEINENVFDNNVYQNATLYVPYGCKSKYKVADGWKNFVKIEEVPNNPESDQEICSFNANNSMNLDANDGTLLVAGTEIGRTSSVIATIGADDSYKPLTVTATVNGSEIRGGLWGASNPKDEDGNYSNISLKAPVNGAFLQFEAMADGWLYVVHSASSNKAYTVFEDGTPIGYTFAAIGDASTDLGAIYKFTIVGEGANNEVNTPIEWAEQEYLKATDPDKYAAHSEGNPQWLVIAKEGIGVIKFKVKSGCKYIVNKSGGRIKAGGFCFETTGDAVIKAGDVTIFGPEYIDFADDAVKALCVANWDTNGDGELSKIEAAAVKDLGDVFKNNNEIESFSELQYFTGLTSINNDAFSFCSNLSLLTIPNGVTKIGGKAFHFCGNLATIVIPNSVIIIEDGAFRACTGLSSMIIPESVISIGYNPFEDCVKLATITVQSGNMYYDSRRNCNAIIEKSSNKLISGCKNTTIPYGVTEIADGAFSLCTGLTSIDIPNGVVSIGNNSFYFCTALSSISIPRTVNSISHNSFSFCGGLTSIAVEARNPVYDSREGCNAIIEKRTNTLVAGCKNTIIPNSVVSIGDFAFSGCADMVTVNIPDGVTSIGMNAFLECSALTSVTIPAKVSSIGIGAFSWCSSLTSVSLPNSVTSIEHHAFYQCNSLTSITSMITELFEINENVFESDVCQNATLYVPVGCKAKYEAAGGWKKFVNIEEMALTPMDDEEEVGFDEMNENTNLSGTIIDNVFFNITSDNGGYDATDNSVVVSKPMSDDEIAAVFGNDQKDLFSDEVKNNFAGMVVEVPAGNGVVTVEAQTTGGLTLKVKIGNADPVEVEFEGKLKLKFPYNVTVPTYAYIFAGETQASVRARTRGENPSLRIYGISVNRNVITGDANGDGVVNYSDVVAVLDRIIGGTSGKFVEAAADVNNDGQITIADALGIVDIICLNN